MRVEELLWVLRVRKPFWVRLRRSKRTTATHRIQEQLGGTS